MDGPNHAADSSRRLPVDQTMPSTSRLGWMVGTGRTDDGRADRWLLQLAILAAVLPFLLVRVAPLCDLPNHLGRVHILANYWDEPGWAAHYSIASELVLPNLAFDAIAVPLSMVVGTELACTAFLCILSLTVIGGAAVVARAQQRPVGATAALTACALHTISLSYGFVNYVFGLGFLLLCVGTWIAMRKSHPTRRIAVSMVLVTLLFFTHLMAFAFYAIAIAAYELVDLWKSETRGSFASHVATAAAQFVIPAVLFFGLSPTRSEAGGWTSLPWDKKLDQFGSVFVLGGPSATWDLLFTAGFFALILTAVLFARGRMRPSGIAITIAMLVMFLIAPQKTATADNISLRVPSAVVLMLAAFLDIRATGRARRVISTAIAALLIGRTVQIAVKWTQEAAPYDAILTAAERVRPHATVYTLRDGYHRDHIRQTWHPPLAHAACLTILRSEVYLPQLFANDGQQPLTVRSPTLRAMRALRGDFLPTYRSAEDFDAWVAAIRAAQYQAQTGAPSEDPIPAVILQLHAEPDQTRHDHLRRLGGGDRWTLWECEP